MKTGRPIKFTPLEMKNKSENYFDFCDDKKKPKTLSGLCLYLGVYKDYISEKVKDPDFSETISYIRLVTENDIEEGILTKKYHHRAGEFNLKNNYGWRDKIETVNSVDIDVENLQDKTPQQLLQMLKELKDI